MYVVTGALQLPGCPIVRINVVVGVMLCQVSQTLVCPKHEFRPKSAAESPLGSALVSGFWVRSCGLVGIEGGRRRLAKAGRRSGASFRLQVNQLSKARIPAEWFVQLAGAKQKKPNTLLKALAPLE